MPNLKTATHRGGHGDKPSRRSRSGGDDDRGKSNPYIASIVATATTIASYLSMRNIAIVAVISLVSYYSYILIDAHINSEKAAEAARVADAAAQHKSVEQLEKIAEKYYNSLLVERKQTLSDLTNDAFLKINPQFPCLFGEVPITKQDENDALVTDGHKYACGLKAISGKPIVYSLGSKDQDFELGVLKYRPEAEIYVFELKSINIPPEAEQDSRITYYNIGLGYNDPKKLKPLVEMMRTLEHTYIDVLKMDIEYAEWHWLARETNLLDRVGQLLIEVHTKDNRRFPYQGPNPGLFFVEKLEEKNLRIFHKEYSTTSKNFVELSLIQKDWSDWELTKTQLPELPPAYEPGTEVERYETEFKIFYGMIPAPTPIPGIQSSAPTPSPKANSKTKGTIFDVSGSTYTDRGKLSTNYLKDKILGSTEVYDTGDAPEEPEPTPPPKKIEASSSFFSNADVNSGKKDSSAMKGTEITANIVDEDSANEIVLPTSTKKTTSSIQSLDDIGGRRLRGTTGIIKIT